MGRDRTKLHPTLQSLMAQLEEKCAERGLALGIGECYRTVEEQDELYAQGRTKAGSIVTNAKGTNYGSQHQWGIAFDFFKNVKGHAYDDDAFFAEVAAIAKGLGLGWGGDWVSFKDRPHLYLPMWGSTCSELKRIYGTPEKFMATWQNISPAPAPKPKGVVSIYDFQRAVLKDGYTLPRYGCDGCWGAETESVAKKALVKVEKPTQHHYRTRLVQEAVGAMVDGYCGEKTKTAIKAYQKASGLVADGVVGLKTWRKLVGVK